jgi:general secretion pathway protein J
MRETMNLQSQRQYRTSDGGFTLIEVLVAVFIGAIVLTVLYASFFQIVKAKERIEEELELYHEARVVMSKMTKDLVTAFPRGLVNTDESNITLPFFLGVRDGDYSSLSFTALSRTPGPNSRESDQTEISYYLEPIPDTDLFALMRKDNPTIENEDGGTVYPISERVTGFNISYLTNPGQGDDTGEFTYEWNSNETASLPAAVNIELVLRNPKGENITFNTLVVIPSVI